MMFGIGIRAPYCLQCKRPCTPLWGFLCLNICMGASLDYRKVNAASTFDLPTQFLLLDWLGVDYFS